MRDLALALALTVGCTTTNQGFSNADTHQTGGVPGAGSLEVEPTELVWTDLDYENQIASSQPIKLTNTGDGTLKVYSVALSDSGDGTFYIEDQGQKHLAPGEDREYTVVATLTEYAMVTGNLQIRSSDADHATVDVPLTAYPIGWETDTGTSDTGSTDTGGT